MKKNLLLISIALLLIISICMVRAAAVEPINDHYLRGYLAAVLEREYHWNIRLIEIEIRNGSATVIVPDSYYEKRLEVLPLATKITGLKDLRIISEKEKEKIIAKEGSPSPSSTEISIAKPLAPPPVQVPLPVTSPFKPLLVDPKEPHFYASYRNYQIGDTKFRMAAVGFGEDFGFYRRQGVLQADDALQIGIAAGVLAQFNLDAPSSDLINADYIVGFPITYRHGALSARLRIYHQSSHLGDEFLLRVRPVRINYSYEAVEGLISYDLSNWRFYGGGEYSFHRDPPDLKPALLHAGLEYRSDTVFFRGGHLVGGLDLKSQEEHNWALDVSAKFGLEFGHLGLSQRSVRVLAEFFNGYSPHGQFYNQKTRYYGLQIGFGF